MKTLSAEQKAKKAAYNKAYAAKKKAQAQTPEWMSLDKFEMAFDHKLVAPDLGFFWDTIIA
jgi:hypothetical protein